MPDDPAVQPDPGSGDPPANPTPQPEPQPTPQPEPAPADDRAKFLNLIPKEYREHASLKDYKDFAGMVKSHVNLVGLLGREPRVPAKDAPPDQWTQFYSALGRPDTPDKYQVPIPEGDDAPTIDPEYVDGFRKIAHEIGLTQSQAHKLAEWDFGFIAKHADDLAVEIAGVTERAERELKRELGNAYDNKLRAATKVFEDFGGKDLLNWMETSGAGSNPHLIRMAIKVADAMSEDRLGSSRSSSFGHTPAEAQREIGRLNLDKEFQTALYDRNHIGHADAVKRRSELFAAAYPTEDPNA